MSTVLRRKNTPAAVATTVVMNGPSQIGFLTAAAIHHLIGFLMFF